MLCTVCMSMFRNPDLEGRHHKDLQDLQKAAVAGCKVCIRLIDLREGCGPDETNEATANPFLAYRFQENFSSDGWEINFLSSVTWANQFSGEIYLTRIPRLYAMNNCAKLLNTAQSDLMREPWEVQDDGFCKKALLSSTGHPEVAKTALQWFNSCRFSHGNCETEDNSRDPRWYPKRLLDVSEPRKGLRLLLTSLEPPKDRYATLSHCWGKSPTFLTLRSDNIKSFRNNIPFQSLPKTFRDAAITCCRLEIKYLWIDSLCIIQSGEGSREDWLEHAVDMRLVYLNCVLNIAVDRASSAEEGAFATRNTHRLQPCHVEWNYSGSEQTLWTVYDDSDTTSDLKSLPLLGRGWVVQERLFSPRILHFANDRIHWECLKTASTCVNEYTFNCHGDEIAGFDALREPQFSLPRMFRNPERCDGMEEKDHDAMDDLWENTVYDYSWGRLTYPVQDKLVAFAGISQRFEEIYHSPYLAGIFYHQLPWGLLWHAWEEAEDAPNGYIAPSWSWASHHGRVTFQPRNQLTTGLVTQELLIEIYDAHVDPVDQSNKHGRVRFGEVTLRGALLSFSSITLGGARLAENIVPECTMCGHPSREFAHDNGAWSPVLHNTTNGASKAERVLSAHLDMVKCLENHADHLYILPVFECFRDCGRDRLLWLEPDGEEHRASYGLILRKSECEGKYERVGIYHSPFFIGKPSIEEGHPEQLVSVI